jgi:PPM family protein phosphatase
MAPDASDEVLFFIRADMTEPSVHDVARGKAGVFTARSPGKPSDNEDSAAIIRADETRGVLVIADGVGGHPGGAMASALAVQAMNDVVRTVIEAGGSLRDAILDGFEQANQSISAIGVGAATTLTAVEIHDGAIRPYHVGDSLILLVGQRGLIKLQTISHSPIGYAVESGLLEEREAMHHEDRHLVSNMLGSPEMRIEIGGQYAMQPLDTLLLASDGLFDNLHTDEIIELIRKGPLERVVANLARECLARMHGGTDGQPSKPDDLTFIAFRRTPQDAPKQAPSPNEPQAGSTRNGQT